MHKVTEQQPGDAPHRPARPLWRRVATACAIAYAALLAVVVAAMWIGADRWWWATLIAFGPRWPWLAPAPIALPLCAFAKRRIAIAAATLAIAATLVGFRAPLSPAGGSSGNAFVIATINTAGGSVDARRFFQALPEGVDAVVMQEGRPEFTAAAIPASWTVKNSENGLSIASPHPLRDYESHQRPYMPAWGQSASRCVVDTPGGPVRVVAVHLRTPRDGFEALMSDKLAGVPKLDAAIQERLEESRVIRAWIEDWDVAPEAPLTIAGDFNTPVESRVYQRHWADLRNAFGAVGFGRGATKVTRWHSIRIDHVLCDPATGVVSCRVAPDLGGDHRAVIATLAISPSNGESR